MEGKMSPILWSECHWHISKRYQNTEVQRKTSVT